MLEEEYLEQLQTLRREWSWRVVSDGFPGVIRPENDLTTGILVGRKAPIIAEIINRALKGDQA